MTPLLRAAGQRTATRTARLLASTEEMPVWTCDRAPQEWRVYSTWHQMLSTYLIQPCDKHPLLLAPAAAAAAAAWKSGFILCSTTSRSIGEHAGMCGDVTAKLLCSAHLNSDCDASSPLQHVHIVVGHGHRQLSLHLDLLLNAAPLQTLEEISIHRMQACCDVDLVRLWRCYRHPVRFGDLQQAVRLWRKQSALIPFHLALLPPSHSHLELWIGYHRDCVGADPGLWVVGV